MLIDESFDLGRQSYTLTRIHHLDGHVLRVEVKRDFYGFQSYATVAVLTPQQTWTVLASTPPDGWHDRTPTKATHAGCLSPIADGLVARGQRILAITSPDTDTATS